MSKEKYRIKKWYAKDDLEYYYSPQVQKRFLFWTYWENLTGFGYKSRSVAEYEIDKRIKDIKNDWPKDEYTEYNPHQ